MPPLQNEISIDRLWLKNAQNAATGAPFLAKVRKNEVLGCYLVSYPFQPRKMLIRSSILVHGWTVVRSIELISRSVSRVRRFYAQKSAQNRQLPQNAVL